MPDLSLDLDRLAPGGRSDVELTRPYVNELWGAIRSLVATKNELATEIARIKSLYFAREYVRSLEAERDASLGETRLALALLKAAEDECDRLKAGLRAIGTHCTSFTGPTTCIENGRTRDAEYTADRWCDGCIARDALGVPSE